MKRISFTVAKAIKEAGYNEPCDMYYHIYDSEYDSEMSLEMTGSGCNDFLNSLNRYRCAAPYVMKVWLWLWREKGIFIDVDHRRNEIVSVTIYTTNDYITELYENSPEEAISGAIEYL